MVDPAGGGDLARVTYPLPDGDVTEGGLRAAFADLRLQCEMAGSNPDGLPF